MHTYVHFVSSGFDSRCWKHCLDILIHANILTLCTFSWLVGCTSMMQIFDVHHIPKGVLVDWDLMTVEVQENSLGSSFVTWCDIKLEAAISRLWSRRHGHSQRYSGKLWSFCTALLILRGIKYGEQGHIYLYTVSCLLLTSLDFRERDVVTLRYEKPSLIQVSSEWQHVLLWTLHRTKTPTPEVVKHVQFFLFSPEDMASMFYKKNFKFQFVWQQHLTFPQSILRRLGQGRQQHFSIMLT